jgi:hypothetical protein
MIVVGAVVGVLVLAGIGAGAFFFLRPSPGPTPTPTPNPQQTPTPGPVAVTIHTVASASPDANVQGWIDAPLVHVKLAAASDAGSPGPASISYSVSGALTLPSTTRQGPTVDFDLVAPGSSTSPEGISTIRFAGQDTAGGQEAQQTFLVKVDRTPPAIDATESPAPTNAWNSTDVTVSFTCRDTIAEIASCEPARTVVTAPGASQTVTGVATNKAGKATAKAVIVNIDKTAPSSAFANLGTNGVALPTNIQGTTTAGPSGISKVEVALAATSPTLASGAALSQPLFWTGKSWSTTETWLPTNNLANWSASLNLPFDEESPGTYRYCTRATNTAGVTQTTATCSNFLLRPKPDVTPPPNPCGVNLRLCTVQEFPPALQQELNTTTQFQRVTPP